MGDRAAVWARGGRRLFRQATLWFCAVALTLLVLDRVGDVVYGWLREEPAKIVARPGHYRALRSRSSSFAAILQVDPKRRPGFDRLAAHRQAADRLLDTALFEQGRGMHASLAARLLYTSLGNDDGWKGAAYRTWFARKTGTNFEAARPPVGFLERDWRGTRVAVQGCAVCHAGKVLGMIVPGLGNKTVDAFELGRVARMSYSSTQAFEFLLPNDVLAEDIRTTAIQFSERISDPNYANSTQSLVPVTTIRAWFYWQANRALPANVTPAAVKVPALWGYGEKIKVGQFCDGMGRGPGWLAGVELVAGQRPETVRGYDDKLRELERTFASLLPPAYPLAIDLERAARGRTVFAEHCRRCHGEYRKDADRLPLFDMPRRVAIDEVDTDRDRLVGNTAEFFGLVATSPLADLIQIAPDYESGYLAPRLEGIWARFPYLHNASVPNIASLLLSADERPRAFSLLDAGEVHRFDPETLGLTAADRDSGEEVRLYDEAGRSAVRSVYIVTRIGQSNAGHEFGVKLRADQKRDLIEYLKTL